jgi:hypothetical protein
MTNRDMIGLMASIIYSGSDSNRIDHAVDKAMTMLAEVDIKLNDFEAYENAALKRKHNPKSIDDSQK